MVTATTFPRWQGDTEPPFVFHLSECLSKKGFEMIILAPHHPGAKHVEKMGNLKVYRFPYFYPKKYQRLCYEGGALPNMERSFLAKVQVPFLILSELYYMAKIIRKEKIDLIHAHWILPQGFLGALCAKLFNIPFVVTAHAGDVFPLKSKFLKFFARHALGNCSACTAVSMATKEAISAILPYANVSIISMGVDLSSFSPIHQNEEIKKRYNISGPFLLTIGRLAEKKGIKYLIESLPFVLDSFPDAKLLVVGDGPEKASLEALSKSLGLTNAVVFVGPVPNDRLPEYYATADIFIGPSIVARSGDTEGLPVVFMEAMASGTAVIGTDVGGIPDIIRNEKTGLLIEEKNYKQLAESIVRLLMDSSLREILRQNAREYIKTTYAWEHVSNKFSELYENVLMLNGN